MNIYLLTYLLTCWYTVVNVYKCRKIDGKRKKQKEKLHFILDAKNKLWKNVKYNLICFLSSGMGYTKKLVSEFSATLRLSLAHFLKNKGFKLWQFWKIWKSVVSNYELLKIRNTPKNSKFL